MESFVHDYIEDELNEGLLERRLSPYATLRPGDLAALLRLQSPLLSLVNKFSSNHGNDNFNKARSPLEEVIFECKNTVLCADRGDDDTCKGKDIFDVVCRGVDTNNSPAEYTVKGLHHYEMPVIGVCVDERICPGFRYLVRRIGSDRYFYNSKPKTLLSVGMGYGKRITFTGDSLNNNECYFWSDSDPNGYAFSIHALDVGQKFSILDSDNVIVGEAVVDVIDEPQQEVSAIVKNRTVTKIVTVTMTCSMKYYQRHNHGLVDMMVHEDTETITGEVVLTKSKSSKRASLKSVEQVYLQRFGLCKLEPDY